MSQVAIPSIVHFHQIHCEYLDFLVFKDFFKSAAFNVTYNTFSMVVNKTGGAEDLHCKPYFLQFPNTHCMIRMQPISWTSDTLNFGGVLECLMKPSKIYVQRGENTKLFRTRTVLKGSSRIQQQDNIRTYRRNCIYYEYTLYTAKSVFSSPSLVFCI